MKMVYILVIFIISTLFQAPLVLSNRNSRIVNGVLAPPGQFPYQISLQLIGDHNCGGSILNENYVLTAAHCVSGYSPDLLTVIAGTVNLNNRQAPASTHHVTSISIHKNYQPANMWNNDIAVVKITPPFKFGQYIAPAKLPSRGAVIRDGAPAAISGFGRTKKNAPTSPRLLKTDVYTLSQAACRKHFPSLKPTKICTNNIFRVTGFCKGDSGGPLTLDGTVVGVVSHALNQGCAGNDQSPQVFSRVSKYIDWINSRIKQ